MPDDALLEIDDLCVAYDGSNALNGVSLRIGKGELICVVGANGAGKTSLIRSIAGIVPSSRGSVRINGVEISRRPPWDICEMGIAQVAEGRQIFSALSVEDNLLIGGSLKRARHDRANTLDSVYQLFGRLRERRDQLAGTLSGGEQQMLAIGRALTLNPKVLLLDEPTEGLAPIIVEELLKAIGTITRAGGICSIIVEQNAQKILGLADRVVILERGTIVHDAPSAALKADPSVLERHLGVAGAAAH